MPVHVVNPVSCACNSDNVAPLTMTATLSNTEAWSLFTLSGSSFAVIANTFQGDGEPLIASLAFSGVAFSATYALIRWLGPTFMRIGLKGRDMCKVNSKEMFVVLPCLAFYSSDRRPSPEAMGAILASVYLLVLIAFIPFPFYKDIVAATSGGGNRDVVLKLEEVETGRFLHRFPHSKVCYYCFSCPRAMQKPCACNRVNGPRGMV